MLSAPIVMGKLIQQLKSPCRQRYLEPHGPNWVRFGPGSSGDPCQAAVEPVWEQRPAAVAKPPSLWRAPELTLGGDPARTSLAPGSKRDGAGGELSVWLRRATRVELLLFRDGAGLAESLPGVPPRAGHRSGDYWHCEVEGLGDRLAATRYSVFGPLLPWLHGFNPGQGAAPIPAPGRSMAGRS